MCVQLALRLEDIHLWKQISRSFEVGTPSLNCPPPRFGLTPEISFPFSYFSPWAKLNRSHPKNLKALGLTDLKPKCWTLYCNTAWPQDKVDDQEVRPMNGSLNYNTTLSQADGARLRHKLEEKTESQVPEGPNINLKIRTRMINKRRS